MDWTYQEAPSLDEFEDMARAAFALLPAEFRRIRPAEQLGVAVFPAAGLFWRAPFVFAPGDSSVSALGPPW